MGAQSHHPQPCHHVKVLAPIKAVSLPVQHPVAAPEKAVEGDPRTTHGGDPDGVLGSWLQPAPAQAGTTILGNEAAEGALLSLSYLSNL